MDKNELFPPITFAELLRQITVSGKQEFDLDVVEAIENNLLDFPLVIVR